MNEIAVIIGAIVAMFMAMTILIYVMAGMEGLKILGLTVVALPVVAGLCIGFGLLCGWLWRAQ